MLHTSNPKDSFSNYISGTGAYDEIMNQKNSKAYVGDHLYKQKDYFFLNGQRISYEKEIDFKNLQEELPQVAKELLLPPNFFEHKLNQSPLKKKKHYSFFYNSRTQKLVENLYDEDIRFFDFNFEERKNLFQKIIANLN